MGVKWTLLRLLGEYRIMEQKTSKALRKKKSEVSMAKLGARRKWSHGIKAF